MSVTRKSPKIAVTVKRNRWNMENGVTLDRRIPNAKIMPFQLNYGVRADDVNRTYRNTVRKCKYLAALKRPKRYTYIYDILSTAYNVPYNVQNNAENNARYLPSE